ncbi:hypothetical protein PT273_00365 [Orbaceae bacterium ESL0727]|nr:hypothetical protein [Orbaceae bacterium ESL0727]
MRISNETLLKILLERDRFNRPPDENVRATGIGIARFVVSCESNAINILHLAKKTLELVASYSEIDWPSLEKWKKILPVTFVDNCIPERTKEEIDEKIAYRKSLPWEKQLKLLQEDEKWSLDEWLYWMEPQNRQWFWWKAYEFDDEIRDTHFLVEVTVYNEPFLWGSLKWLFKACGAIDVISTDDL